MLNPQFEAAYAMPMWVVAPLTLAENLNAGIDAIDLIDHFLDVLNV